MGKSGNTKKVDNLLRKDYSNLPLDERPWAGTNGWLQWLAHFRTRHSQEVSQMEAPGRHTEYLAQRAIDVLEFMWPKESEQELIRVKYAKRQEAIKEDWKRKATPLVKALIGNVVPNRSVSMDVCDSVLKVFHEIGCESIFALFLDGESKCIHSEIRFGNEDSVLFSPVEIVRIAIQYSAKKVVLAHNHPNEHPEPSDADIRHAAAIASRLPAEIEFVDNLVWCQLMTVSVLNDERYMDMVRPY